MKDNMKWLLLIPVAVALAVVMIIFIPRILSSDSSASESKSGSGQTSVSSEELSSLQASIDAGKAIIEANPSDVVAIKELGRAYVAMGQAQADSSDANGSLASYKAAIDQFRKYLALNPQDNEVRRELGSTYVDLGLADLGERELRMVTGSAPTDQRAWLSLGWALAQQGKLDEAVKMWQTAYNMGPQTDVGRSAKQYLDEAATEQAGAGASAGAAGVTP